jgi:hypothetical protein
VSIDRPARYLSRVAVALTGLLAVVFTLRPIDDFDVWYHLAAGRLMAHTWRWPMTNTFAFTTPLHPWVDVHWVFQLLLYGVWVVGGATGAILLTSVLVLATVTVLYADARRFAPPSLVALLLTVALVVASPRFVPRPELLTFFLLAIFLWLLDDYPHCGRAIYFLVPLQILWMNAHGTVPIGVVLVGCYWLGATLAFLPALPSGWRAATVCTRTEWRRLTIVLALVALACLATPWGVAGALLPLDLLPAVTGGSLLSSRIGEFRPPFQAGFGLPLAYTWVGLLVLSGLAFAMNVSRVHLGRLFTVLVFGYLSTQALRNVALFAWMAVPATAANVGSLVARRAARQSATLADPRRGTRVGVASPRPDSSLLVRVGEGAVIAITSLLIAIVVTNQLSKWLGVEREFGLGISKLHAPIDALRFADTVGIEGNPFNDFASGGYLAWARFPRDRVFVDGRTQAYPDDFFRFYFNVMDDPEQWPTVVARFAPDYALLYHVWSNRFPLVRYLNAGHGWTLVYYDEIASLYMPLDDAHRAVRERAEQAFAALQAARTDGAEAPVAARGLWDAVRVPVAAIRRDSGYGDFLLAIGKAGSAVEPYKRVLAADPSIGDVRFDLGIAYWSSGHPNEAMAEWRDVLRRDPRYERARTAIQEGERRMNAR